MHLLTSQSLGVSSPFLDASAPLLLPCYTRSTTMLAASVQVAQQDAERARFTVTRAEQDKKSTIVRAKGEAESAKLIGQAVKDNPAFIALRKIEAAREIADTVATAPNRLYLNSDSLLLDLTPKGQERS